jgi:hypothetical protein
LLSKRLEFASLIAYAPRPDDVPPGLREEARRSRNLVLSLKDGRAIGEPPVTVAARIALYLRDSESTARALSGFLNPSATLVPVPRSTLGTKGALWVPEELRRELAGHGFGGGVAPLLERTESIPKAAKTSRWSARRRRGTTKRFVSGEPCLTPPPCSFSWTTW